MSSMPWNVYPRPMLRRAEWQCLNGEWELSCEGESCPVTVPYPLESRLSGAIIRIETGKTYVYKRSFTPAFRTDGREVWLNFGAVMRKSRVFVNGEFCAEHDNGYLPFSVNVTQHLREGDNELKVEVTNDLDPRYPYGKQRVKRGGMWYTPCTGIWQTVWLEPRPREHITGISTETDGAKVTVTVGGVKTGMISYEGGSFLFSGGRAELLVKSPELWSPENPRLYDITVKAGEDEVKSYFALRTVAVEEINGKKRITLNGKPYFFHGLLDQGYWADGLYTPEGPEAFQKDILAIKSLGFNTLRKHIKIEPELYYYACDKLGVCVFQDMVNSGRYSFIRDSVLPTAGLQKKSDRRLFRDKLMRENFLRAMDGTVRLLKAHPSIVLWTVFNEGWGQFEAAKAYDKLRELDKTRLIDSASGWYRCEKSDVESMHIYFRRLSLGKEDRAQLLSEYGGWSYKLPEHSFNLKKTYGYKKYEDRPAFVRDLRELMMAELVPLAREGLCGAVYTQVSDVEDETNGLFTFDREVLKVRPEELSGVAEALQRAVSE
ncbi:MAG: glycoside hydrolase family 2 [Oscillospiraceae bacterium]|nr:glycoside hydrolase family 2 [Oscillospiraceae bacterium]